MNPTPAAAAQTSQDGALTSECKVGIGELAVLCGTGRLRTLLGSCIGLVLHDATRRVGGLAHIVLPASNGEAHAPGKYADTALPALLAKMRQAGAQPKSITAKLAGGANMFATKVKTIGDQNLETMENLLKQAGIPLVGMHCGGTQGRRLTFDVETGAVTIGWAGGSSIIL